VAKPHAKPRGRVLLDLVLESLDEDQAIDPKTINLSGKSLIADQMVVASGRSQRHVAAMADHLVERCKAEGIRARTEGMPRCDWVLIDCGDVVVHLFRPEIRDFYNIEKMWSADLPSDLPPPPAE
jgi:ribosome-associated protein